VSNDKAHLCIGLMSGTSADSIDAALVDFSGKQPQLKHYIELPLADNVRQQILTLMQPGDDEIEQLGRLDHQLGHAFAQAAQALLSASNTPASRVRAIGSHGQTLRHRPPGTSQHPFTLQIGDANIIAEETGICTIADFRRRDIAAGGQGAPLVPAFHQAVFSSAEESRVIANIGGISNITLLAGNTLQGFDTGPGNTLMDAWIHEQQGERYDQDGQWASTGRANRELVEQLLQHDFFQQIPPKSTGREDFNLNWLKQQVELLDNPLETADIQASLLEVTAQSLVGGIKQQAPNAEAIYVCGGGAFNSQLLKCIETTAQSAGLKLSVRSTSALGIAPESVEATAFAWLAQQTLENLPGNNPATTGARREVILGGIYPA